MCEVDQTNEKDTEESSIDGILGGLAQALQREWELAPDGKKKIDDLGRDLYEISHQLKSYGDLL